MIAPLNSASNTSQINGKTRNLSLGNNVLPSTDVRATKAQKPIKPLIPAKSLTILLKDKPEKTFYNRRLIDYKNTGLLQYYISIGGKLLPRRQTRLSAKQQRFVAKTVKSARVMGLLPFVSKERGFFR
jgi:small subunit ribosomal protein S18